MRHAIDLMKKAGIWRMLPVLACAGMALHAHADVVTIDASTVFLPSGSPTTGTSAGVATITDESSGVVDVTLAFSGVPSPQSTYYQISEWALNLIPSYTGTITGTFLSSVGPVTVNDPNPTFNNYSPFKSELDNAGYYSLVFNNFNETFFSGDSVTYQLSGTGLDAADFEQLSSTSSGSYTSSPGSPDGNYYEGLLVEGGASGPSQNYYLGATSYTDVSSAPDGGSTMILFLLSLATCGLGGMAKKLSKV